MITVVVVGFWYGTVQYGVCCEVMNRCWLGVCQKAHFHPFHGLTVSALK